MSYNGTTAVHTPLFNPNVATGQKNRLPGVGLKLCCI